jgi:inorganic pyrophosphatase/exopolyphosphatase
MGSKDKLPIFICSGTILLDTVNLSPAAQRATPKDIKAIGELEECLSKIQPGGRPVREEIYAPIVKARSDISQLTPEQLLRKDCKLLKTPEISIGIPAVPLLSQVSC